MKKSVYALAILIFCFHTPFAQLLAQDDASILKQLKCLLTQEHM